MRMVSPTRTCPARSAPRPVLLPVRGAVRGVTSPGLRPERDRELVGARQLLEVTESKMLQKQRRRPVEQRSAHSLTAADDVDETPLVQRLEDAANGDPANLLDLGASNRLTVRDDRERLERRRRQSLRARGQLRALDRLGVLDAREDLPPSGKLRELDAMTVGLVVLAQLVQRLLDDGGRRLGIQGGQLVGRNRARARKERGLKQLRQRPHGRSPRRRRVAAAARAARRAWPSRAGRGAPTALATAARRPR